MAANLGGCYSTTEQPLRADVWHRARSQSSATGVQGRERGQEGWDPLVAAAPLVHSQDSLSALPGGPEALSSSWG